MEDKQRISISVLGCGWLGFPLALQLKESGYRVNGSVRDPAKMEMLKQGGIDPFLIEVSADGIAGDLSFFNTDILIIDIPPGRTPDVKDRYPAQIRECILAAKSSGVQHILFTGSTSVYPEVNRLLTEEFIGKPEKASGFALLKSERILMESGISSTVLRFGGLIGDDRNPAASLVRKKIKLVGDSPVNLIHQTDCIGIILAIIESGKWGFIFNACAPQHPSKRDFYSRAAGRQNLEIPAFSEAKKTAFKIVDSSKLINTLNYSFIYPDPMEMY